VLLPDPDLEAAADRVLGPLLLEGRADDDRLAPTREEEPEGPLAPAPAHAGEVRERCAGLDEECVDPGLAHQVPRPLAAAFPLLLGDRRRRLRRSGRQRGDRRGERLVVRTRWVLGRGARAGAKDRERTGAERAGLDEFTSLHDSSPVAVHSGALPAATGRARRCSSTIRATSSSSRFAS